MECTPVILAHEEPFRIGPAEVRPATRELTTSERTAILEPRVMQVLVALHRANGAVVSKDDLVTCCWDGRIVGDDAINRVIGRLRHDAAEHAGKAFRIETITRVGYRLVEHGDAHSRPSIDRRRLVVSGAAAAAVAGTGAVGWLVASGPRGSDAANTLLEEARVALRQATPDQVDNAVAKLRSASELDPNNADIWGALALAYRMQVGGSPPSQRAFTLERSAEARRRALALDPDNADALAAGLIALPIYGRWAEFEKMARAALERQPEHATLNRALASSLAEVGRWRAAIPYLDRAYAAEPMAVGTHVMRMFALWAVGRPNDAEGVINRAHSLWPKHFGVWFSRVYLLAYTGRAEQAMAMILDKPSRPIGIPDWNFEFTRQQIQALVTGTSSDIEKAMATCLDVAKRGTGFAENVAMYASFVGRIDDAYRVLDAYYFDRGFAMGDRRWSDEQGIYADRRYRNTDFLFQRPCAGLRRDGRFALLTRSVGLADYWRKTGTRPDYLA